MTLGRRVEKRGDFTTSLPAEKAQYINYWPSNGFQQEPSGTFAGWHGDTHTSGVMNGVADTYHDSRQLLARDLRNKSW
jgi:hypothetical protein